MDLNALKLLVEIVEAGTLSAAARRLNTSRSNVSHRLKAFEQSVGVELFRRTTRRIEPTEVGRALYQHGSRILREMEAAEEVVARLGRGEHGYLRVSVPIMFGQLFLAPLLLEFARLYPDISLNVTFSNRVHDLIESAVDIAFRVMSDPPEGYAAREIAAVRWIVCAAPPYLERRGAPDHPSQLGSHVFITMGEHRGRFRLRSKRNGEVSDIQLRPHLQSDNVAFAKNAVVAGLGIGVLPSFIVPAELERQELVELLPDYDVSTVVDKVVMITGPGPSRANTLLVEFLMARLKLPGAVPAPAGPARRR
jgi:DNA-binding transcriptional LysR family regulator